MQAQNERIKDEKMKGWLKGLIGVFIAVLLLGVPLISSYNGLITEEAMSMSSGRMWKPSSKDVMI